MAAEQRRRATVEPDLLRFTPIVSELIDEQVAKLQAKRGLCADDARRAVYERIVFAGVADVQGWVEEL